MKNELETLRERNKELEKANKDALKKNNFLIQKLKFYVEELKPKLNNEEGYHTFVSHVLENDKLCKHRESMLEGIKKTTGDPKLYLLAQDCLELLRLIKVGEKVDVERTILRYDSPQTKWDLLKIFFPFLGKPNFRREVKYL